ncbi:YjzD family protein [Jeotgalibaca sp. MA1X17-3]|uniref:YjzD family protein n=1 Tax=Jeotgalibaca sp. MA1X17-3 TaxID=2908211 RepID=UPI001F263215|nr:YjzD family protein [Jeotgalibaca sp. MA1X17-3]UJF14862.1 YjzD family protein [Jeotgalibaca sp. MA1X17-3]
MRFVVTLVWGFILGHVAFYIGSALEGNAYNFVQASILGIVLALAVFVLTGLFPKTEQNV